MDLEITTPPAPDNFLTHSFNLKPGTDTWRFLQNQFEEAYKMKDVITHIPTRTQNRLHRYTPVPPADVMKNEPDTDFDLAQNQEWVRNIFAKCRYVFHGFPKKLFHHSVFLSVIVLLNELLLGCSYPQTELS